MSLRIGSCGTGQHWRHMTRLSKSLALTVLLAAGLIAFGSAQGRPDPFFDHGDKGEIIHVLPAPASIHSPHDTQLTYAPPSSETAVYPASYGSGSLIDHGGAEIAGAGFVAIYWNTAVSNSTQTSLGWGTIEQQIDGFINAFGNNSNDYAIVQQYGSHATIAPNLVNVGFYPDNQPTSR